MSEIPYALILDSLWEGVCTVDHERRITYFNPAAEQITGHSAANVVGGPFSAVFCPERCQGLKRIEAVLSQGMESRNESATIQCRRNKPVSIQFNATPIRDGDGPILGAAMIFRDISDVEVLRRELRCEYCEHDIVTKSHRMRQLLDILPNVAQSDSPALILGESGTGKELLARAIHTLSHRAEGPFIAVNCGALPDNLLESELFGYKAGAFTDAKKDKPGRFARAENGTLFLDEIGDISQAMQVKLLRVLQEKLYEPLGAVESVATNARIVAATNKDLKQMVADGEFRSDLYYRINVVELRLPSLSERREDIPLLIEHFIEKHNAEKGKAIRGIAQSALNRLMMHDFPGNIRELENIVERAYVMCPFDEIQEGCLQLDVMPGARTPCARDGAPGAPSPAPPANESLDGRRKAVRPDDEKQMILDALEVNNGHRRRTAESLGIDPSTLWRKMKKHGIAG